MDPPGRVGAPAAGSATPSATASTARSADSSAAGSVATRTAPERTTGRPGPALTALAALPVKGRAPMTGYSREAFGPAWADVDRNGCDTRNDVLRRDLTGVRARPGTHGCVVLSGTLPGPYSGRQVAFLRGERTSTKVQIDHVVALGDAWAKGARSWTAARREQFANDPLNLLAVDGPLNEAKGAGDAATWLPPNRGFRCRYVARQTAVKARYRLWVTAAERAAIARVLGGCPDQRLPTGAEEPLPPSVPAPRTPAAAPGGGSVRYPNCAAVRAAGAAPLHRGDPGYRPALDGDGDGSACE